MHYFIKANQDTYISSGSDIITGDSFTKQNFGQDQILELKKVFYNEGFLYPTRLLIQFDLTKLSSSLVNNEITNPEYYLRLYESEGNKNLSATYNLAAYPVSQSWDEGVGKFGDSPRTTDGSSWKYSFNRRGDTFISWSNSDGSEALGSSYVTEYFATQSFSYESPDVNMNVTPIVNFWLGKASTGIGNNGLMLRFSGSHETVTGSEETKYGEMKFFSAQTNTIFSPKLEVRWDDHKPCTGSNTGSLQALDMSGESDNLLYMKGLRQEYKPTETVKFRVGSRKRYIQKSFTTSVQTVTGSYIAEGSGSYSIVDIASGETIIPFSAYTSMSCDSVSNYFIQRLDEFETNRVFKILYRLKYNDTQEQIFDDDFEFIVKD